MEYNISGHTRLLALIGSPVGHSLSPAMYNYSFERLGLDYVYVAFDVDKEHTRDAIEAMRLFNMRGGNVTMPCKQAAAECMDFLSPAARIIGAANTIVNDNGVMKGYITDGEGFVDNLKDHGISVAEKKITVAGAGGAATAIEVQCALDGARKLTILKRKNATFERTVRMAETIETEAPGTEVNVIDINDEESKNAEVADSDIFVNATSVGMSPDSENESVIKDTSVLREGLVVADTVYNPLKTKLLADAERNGCVTVDGKGMLLWQGVAAFKLFTGREMPVNEVKERYFS